MSAKQEKKRRRLKRRIYQSEKNIYDAKLSVIESIKPPRWRIFKYHKWFKLKSKWLKLKLKAQKGCK